MGSTLSGPLGTHQTCGHGLPAGGDVRYPRTSRTGSQALSHSQERTCWIARCARSQSAPAVSRAWEKTLTWSITVAWSRPGSRTLVMSPLVSRIASLRRTLTLKTTTGPWLACAFSWATEGGSANVPNPSRLRMRASTRANSACAWRRSEIACCSAAAVPSLSKLARSVLTAVDGRSSQSRSSVNRAASSGWRSRRCDRSPRVLRAWLSSSPRAASSSLSARAGRCGSGTAGLDNAAAAAVAANPENLLIAYC